jgi:hypothetical protein
MRSLGRLDTAVQEAEIADAKNAHIHTKRGILNEKQGGIILNVWKPWSVMGFYWFIVCLIAGDESLYDFAFILTFVGYYLSWFFLGVTAIVLLDRKVHFKKQVQSWFKK